MSGAWEWMLPVRCAGCHAPGVRLCARCARALAQPPELVMPTVELDVPVWACGPYGGAHRQIIVEMKERGRVDVIPHAAAVLRAALEFMAARGELPEPQRLSLVPAPTTRRNARRRGGDHVTALCRHTRIPTSELLFRTPSARDSVGLSAAERRRNLSGSVRVRRAPRPLHPVLLVDDVLTTGSTLAASRAALAYAGVMVIGAITLAAA